MNLITFFIFLLLDLFIFFYFLYVIKKYFKEQRIISNNLETLILSFETTKHLPNNCFIPIKTVDDNTFFDYCTVFKSKEKNLFYIVPDSLYFEFRADNDYEELYRL